MFRHTLPTAAEYNAGCKDAATCPEYWYSDADDWAQARSRNADDPTSDNFSILDQLEGMRDADGKFTFKLIYPELLPKRQVWRQAVNPATEEHWNNPTPPVFECTVATCGDNLDAGCNQKVSQEWKRCTAVCYDGNENVP